jgi:hypothetical protein
MLSENGRWFAALSPETGKVCQKPIEIGKHRDSRVRKDRRRWMDRVRLRYYSPHKFRHGHAVHALKKAKDITDLKAVSQNLMHSNLSITDGVYGVLSKSDVRERISALGVDTVSTYEGDSQELIAILEHTLRHLKHDQALLSQEIP